MIPVERPIGTDLVTFGKISTPFAKLQASRYPGGALGREMAQHPFAIRRFEDQEPPRPDDPPEVAQHAYVVRATPISERREQAYHRVEGRLTCAPQPRGDVSVIHTVESRRRRTQSDAPRVSTRLGEERGRNVGADHPKAGTGEGHYVATEPAGDIEYTCRGNDRSRPQQLPNPRRLPAPETGARPQKRSVDPGAVNEELRRPRNGPTRRSTPDRRKPHSCEGGNRDAESPRRTS
jgi:hypothetical protein